MASLTRAGHGCAQGLPQGEPHPTLLFAPLVIGMRWRAAHPTHPALLIVACSPAQARQARAQAGVWGWLAWPCSPEDAEDELRLMWRRLDAPPAPRGRLARDASRA